MADVEHLTKGIEGIIHEGNCAPIANEARAPPPDDEELKVDVGEEPGEEVDDGVGWGHEVVSEPLPAAIHAGF